MPAVKLGPLRVPGPGKVRQAIVEAAGEALRCIPLVVVLVPESVAVLAHPGGVAALEAVQARRGPRDILTGPLDLGPTLLLALPAALAEHKGVVEDRLGDETARVVEDVLLLAVRVLNSVLFEPAVRAAREARGVICEVASTHLVVARTHETLVVLVEVGEFVVEVDRALHLVLEVDEDTARLLRGVRARLCVIGARVGEDKLIHLSLVINADASDRQEQYAEANQHTDGAAWGIHELLHRDRLLQKHVVAWPLILLLLILVRHFFKLCVSVELALFTSCC
mmetsp:Transcript_13216/g.31375  ORF Transcript_13216/g.31375 Transcript_13216/m.31375 type:complete len:281 (+) Transcript_13216:523-1365(+)